MLLRTYAHRWMHVLAAQKLLTGTCVEAVHSRTDSLIPAGPFTPFMSPFPAVPRRPGSRTRTRSPVRLPFYLSYWPALYAQTQKWPGLAAVEA